ncbi:MAG: dockerin type I domain-containing protein [Planctomycetota bacterium]
MQARAQILAVVATLVLGTSTLVSGEAMVYLRGDFDGDGALTERDVFHAIDYWFSQATVASIESTDLNDDGQFDVADVNALVEIVFTGTRRYLPSLERVEFIRGDVNHDGVLDDADYVLMRSYLDGSTTDVEILDSMDVAQDGRLTEADLRGLVRLIAAQPQPREGSTG